MTVQQETTAAADARGGSKPSHRWWALAAVCFGLFMALLDVTIVNVALPTIQKSLNASFADLQWVINGYALVFAVVLVTSARLGDIFGRKRLFMFGMGVFSLGSLLCSVSGDLVIGHLTHATVLNLSRGVQGLGASAMMPLSLAIITSEFHGRERGTAIGIWGGVSGLATAIGPLVGGVLVAKVDWQSIFYLNVPIGVIGIALSWWAIRESRDDRSPRTIDVFGLVTLTVSMFCLVLALMQANDSGKGWTSPYILTLFAIAGVALAAFIFGELRLRYPMVDPRLFRNRSFTGSAIAAFCLSAGLYALFFYLTLYLQNLLGFSALGAGLRVLPLSALVLVGAPLSGRLTDRFGPRLLVFGALALLAIAVALMSRITPADGPSDWTVLLPAFLIAGVGNGMANPPISTLAVGTVPPHRAGMASGVNNVCRQVGIAFGIAFLGALLSHWYNRSVALQVSSLNAPGLSGAARAGIITGVQHAGTIAGSYGLTGSPQSATFAHNPLFPAVAHIARVAYVDSTADVFRFAAAILAFGAIASLVLIRRSDLLHRQAGNS